MKKVKSVLVTIKQEEEQITKVIHLHGVYANLSMQELEDTYKEIKEKLDNKEHPTNTNITF